MDNRIARATSTYWVPATASKWVSARIKAKVLALTKDYMLVATYCTSSRFFFL